MSTLTMQPTAHHPTQSPNGQQSVSTEEYQIRPPYEELFQPRAVQQLMKLVLQEALHDREYDAAASAAWSKEIATTIKNKLKEMGLKRYKYLVQVMIGEQKGAGIRVGARCLWDQQTDKIAQETYQNSSLFCVAVAFGVYLY